MVLIFLTSAKTGEGVADVFEYITYHVNRKWEYEEQRGWIFASQALWRETLQVIRARSWRVRFDEDPSKNERSEAQQVRYQKKIIAYLMFLGAKYEMFLRYWVLRAILRFNFLEILDNIGSPEGQICIWHSGTEEGWSPSSGQFFVRDRRDQDNKSKKWSGQFRTFRDRHFALIVGPGGPRYTTITDCESLGTKPVQEIGLIQSLKRDLSYQAWS